MGSTGRGVVTAELWCALCMFLAVALVLQAVISARSAQRRWRRSTPVILPIAAALVVTPLAGFATWQWAFGANIVPSVPLASILADEVWRNATGQSVLDRRARSAAWGFGAVAGMLLYPMALGLGSFDPYALGWEVGALFVLTLMVTLSLLAARNRFGVVLIAAVLGYDLQLTESTNLWDYLVDPAFAVLGTLVLVRSCRCAGRRIAFAFKQEVR